jgi:membrane-bound lytic murein transglycosylase D
MAAGKAHLTLVFLFCFFSMQGVAAQVVPDRIDFAGMQLFFTKKAKARIQDDVDRIKKSATYFQQKVDRANLFFPVIEKVFAEEGFPAEFKYLALQESSLVSDAVSSSQAVGYWQFKKESAVEVGVKVDQRVDERMNIYASSKGAAKYLKRNQAVLNNWIYTLLSYNTGLGGVKFQVNNEYVGAQQMEIDEDMHWYVLRFLAHKIAYEGMVGNAHHSSLHLVSYKLSQPKKLQDIAKETGLNEQLVLEYNKWCLHQEIPGDKEYTVILPVPVADREQYIAKYERGEQFSIPVPTPFIASKEPVHGTIIDKEGVAYAAIDEVPDWTTAPMRVSINRVKAVRIASGEDIHSVTLKAGISKEAFLRFNEITLSHPLISGNYYYLQLKRMKALVSFHTAKKGESVWSIAQHYGIKQGAIFSKNRMDKHEALKEGRVLWLRDKRPKDTPIEYKKVEELKPVEPIPVLLLKPMPTYDTLTPVIKPTILLSDQYIYHSVKQGETMFGISRSYNVSSDSILFWNGMTDYVIKTGQDLIVGRKLKTQVKHTVSQGETLYKIAQQYKIDVATLLKNNKKTEAAIKIGEELIISP